MGLQTRGMRKRTATLRLASSVLAILTLLATACSSNGGSHHSTNGTNPPPTGAPIKVGVIYPDNNQVINEPQVKDTAQAAADYYNAHGGLSGHPISIVACNDQANPNVAAQCASQMVTANVSAVIGWSLFDVSIVPVLSAHNIAYFPVIPNQPASFNSPGVFDVQAGTAQLVAIGPLAQSANIKTVDFFLTNSGAITSSLEQLVSTGMQSIGGKVGHNIVVPPTAADYAPYVAQISAPGVDVTLSDTNMVAFAKAYQQAGIKTQIVSTPGTITAQVVQQTGGAVTPLNGALLYAPFPGPSDPAWGTLSTVLKSYAPSNTLASVPDQDTDGVWVDLLVLKQVLAKKLSDYSSSTILSALNTDSDVSTGGLTPTMNFTKPGSAPYSRIFNRTAYFLQLKDGQFTSPDNNAPHTLNF